MVFDVILTEREEPCKREEDKNIKKYFYVYNGYFVTILW